MSRTHSRPRDGLARSESLHLCRLARTPATIGGRGFGWRTGLSGARLGPQSVASRARSPVIIRTIIEQSCEYPGTRSTTCVGRTCRAIWARMRGRGRLDPTTIGAILFVAACGSTEGSTNAPSATTSLVSSSTTTFSDLSTTSELPPVSEPITTPIAGPESAGETAVWTLAPTQALGSDTTSFTALVTRLECNDGVTGEVLPPVLDFSDDEVVITFTVRAPDPRDHNCPGNDEVEYVVDMGQALGARQLVDGACRSTSAESTSFCEAGATRS